MGALKRPSFGALGRMRPAVLSPKKLGILVIVVVVVFGIAAFQKDRIAATLSSGDTVQAEFPRDYKLVNYKSRVKMAGVIVGKVTGSEKTDHGTFLVSMKLDDGVREKLGSQPSAAIRPTLLVGGDYYVSLTPGDHTGEFPGDVPIPVERTTVPVELDHVLQAVTPHAKQGLQAAIGQTDATLREGGREAVKKLLENAPATLNPAGDVLHALRGTRPGKDLTELVSGFQSAAEVLTKRDGQLAATLDSLHDTSVALSAAREPMAQAVATSPETLRTTRSGLTDLQGTLDRLTETAGEFRPSAQELGPLLDELDPVVAKAGPLVNDLRGLLDDAEPLVRRLVPTARDATGTMRDVDGPVLNRVNGPLRETVFAPWKGHGVYEGGGNDNLFYEELGFLAVDGAKVFQTHDHNGALGRLMAGVGGRSVFGSAAPRSVEQYLEMLGLNEPGPQEGSGPGGGDPSQLGGTR